MTPSKQMSRHEIGPRFSVVIAVYNGDDYIERAVESALNQTYPPYEVIIVDDGSTDRTAEKMRRYAEMIQYFYQDNEGVSVARNVGSNLAQGDWLAFLDADDWYYPDRLKLHAEFIAECPNLDFLVGDFDYVGIDGKIVRGSMESTPIGSKLIHKSSGSDRVLMEGEELGDFVEQQFSDLRTLSVRRKTFCEVGGFPRYFQICEDVHLLIRLCAISQRVGVICKPMAAYFVHDEGLVRSDIIRSQQETVKALLSLRKDIFNASPWVRRGWKRALRRARLDFAYALLRSSDRSKAVRAVFPLLFEMPGVHSLRDISSIVRGFQRPGERPSTQ